MNASTDLEQTTGSLKPNGIMSSNSCSQPYWAVVQVESQCEHVVRLLLMRARYETYMPRILRARSRIAPLFPGYLFVRIVDRWYPVIWTVGVVRLLMSGDQPARLPEKAMTEIRKREIGGFVKLPSPPRLRKDQPVRIIRGSFEGQIAIHQGMSGKERALVLLNLLGQKVPVELPSRDLEPLPVAVR
jgi:transcription antitermination factor NusG